MASADFSLHRAGKVQAQCPASPFQALCEISQGKARDLRSIHPPHIRPLGPECHRASGLLAPLPTSQTPPMRFVFLGPELYLQLPSRVSSRSYGCCSARGSRHSGPPGDSHPQVTSPLVFTSGLSAPVTALRAMPGAPKKETSNPYGSRSPGQPPYSLTWQGPSSPSPTRRPPWPEAPGPVTGPGPGRPHPLETGGGVP